MRLRLFFASVFLATVIGSFAQEKSNIKFGKIGPEDFQKKVYEIDSSANAVIIADIGSTEILGNNRNTKTWIPWKLKFPPGLNWKQCPSR